jgi:hypothetical protein
MGSPALIGFLVVGLQCMKMNADIVPSIPKQDQVLADARHSLSQGHPCLPPGTFFLDNKKWAGTIRLFDSIKKDCLR